MVGRRVPVFLIGEVDAVWFKGLWFQTAREGLWHAGPVIYTHLFAPEGPDENSPAIYRWVKLPCSNH